MDETIVSTSLQAFSVFASKLLEGNEGVFFSEKQGNQERWIFGWGKKRNVDFAQGPFPFFSLTSFKGDMKYFWYFENTLSSIECAELENKEFPQVLNNIIGELTFDLAQCSNETEESFVAKAKRVRHAAENGDVWVLNLAHQLSGKMENETVLLSLFYRFLKLQKDHCGGVVFTNEQKMCSMSPEIFLHQKGQTLSTFPIKGTGTLSYLKENKKEISELAMVTDLLRNDLGQIAQRVWVEKERVLVNRGDFWDAHSEVFASLGPQADLTWEMYRKLLPAGSISGAPKKRVMEYISELESFERGFYTGTFGVKFSPTESIFNILIRTLFLNSSQPSPQPSPKGGGRKKEGGSLWEFPVGAGITYESDPRAEWKETFQKAEILKKVSRI
ncbi:chorismate-binding protein [Candidatus Gracilibacteria bacterium]|nr:chorismate-binding protein [Candidatus Gracilibacteria bacterium]